MAEYLPLVNRRDAPVEILAKKSLQGLSRASRAGVLVFTHGLYGSPDLTRRRVVVNLWHGFGPKSTYNRTFRTRIRFDLMPCNTPVWAAAAARALGAPGARLIRSGTPRQANLQRPPNPSALQALGLDGAPYILWMPTYRWSKGTWGFPWHDAPALSDKQDQGEPTDAVTAVARSAQAAGVRLVVKPHPLDGDRYERDGLQVISTEQIFRAGMTLYQFIGCSAGMISDYSSVWVEYLELDRPVLLYCPDISQYREGRGMNPPYLTDVAHDLIVERAADIRPFFEAVSRGSDWRPEARKSAWAALGLDGLRIGTEPLTAAVLGEVARRRREGRSAWARRQRSCEP
jgi:CDP-glycerol glycerophosphotransferase (TagB/SpsB family)